jgi:hypothetical protein
MKPLHFDAINPFTGTPFLWGDSNLRFVNGMGVYLEPGDEGFVPYPGQVLPTEKKKKKPFRRTPRQKTDNPTHIPTTMSKFKYTIAPLASGGFTTRAVRGALADQASITSALATAAGVTPVQVETVILTLFSQLLESASRSDWSPELYGCFSFRPTSGGNEALPTDFINAEDINADVALTISAEKIRQWRSGLSLESTGEVGLITPTIDSIIDMTTSQPDKYTVANMIQLRGSYLRFKLADLTQGTFFRSGSAAEVRGTLYGQNEPGIVSVAVPAALTGPLTVRHAAYINGSVRSYTYTHLITP